MNGPFRVAQADVAVTPSGKPVRIVKVAKPFGEQSVVVALSYDGSVKADLSAIAGEKITLVHIGEKLIILFDNKSTVTLEPFFDSTGKPLDGIQVEVSPGRELTGAEFAQLFPVTEDGSILPAAGEGDAGGAQASGAYFTSVGIDPLSAPNPLALLGQEELPNFVISDILNPLQLDLLPLQTDIKLSGIAEEEQLGSFNEGPARGLVYFIGTQGNDDPNDNTAPKGNGANADGLDSDTTNDPNAVTQIFEGTGANSLSNLFTSGDPPLTFSVRTDAAGHEVTDSSGHPVTSGGQALHYGTVDTSVAGQTTIVAGIGDGGEGQPATPVFQLTIFANGDYQFVLLHSIDHPDHTTDIGSTSNGSLEETLFLDLTSLVTVSDANGSTANLTGANVFDIGVIDDTPDVHVLRAEGEGASLVIDPLDESIGGDRGAGNNGNGASDDVPPHQVPDPTGVNAIGEVKSAAGALLSLFEVLGSTGADGFGSITYAMSLTLSGAGQNGGVATQLSVTDLTHAYGNDSTIYLFAENGQIVGHVGGEHGAVALRISLENPSDPSSAYLVVDQYLPINHGSDGNNFDAAAALKLAGNATLGVVLEAVLTDGDEDSATSSQVAVIASNDGSAITFEDDGPSIDPKQNSSLRDWTIDEDVLPAAGHVSPVGNDSYDTPADTNDYTQISNKPLGVDWGTDGAKALTFSATDSTHPTITITDQNGAPVAGGLSSGGVPLTYEITTNPDGGQTLIAYKGTVHSSANEVFKLTLDPDADPSGAFSFQLLGALDHPNGNGQNTLNLNFGFNATDGDNDTATSSLTLRITDDVPYAKDNVISRTVDEDDINTAWSQGTHPSDGSGDGSLTESSTGAAIVTGTLAGLVAPGADLPGKFDFTADAKAQLAALGLFSKQTAQGDGENGKPLYYETTNGAPGSNEIVITGREPSPQGNPVFSLTLNTVTGAYEFRLYDELIHMPGGDENTGLRSGLPVNGQQQSIPYIDLGSIITYTDRDGDPVVLTGKFTITITDDVPHADIDLKGGSVTIDESAGLQADDTNSSSVKALFAALESTLVNGQRLVGDDPDVSGDNNGSTPGNGAIAYARSNFAVVTDDSVIGSDSPPYPHTYTLSVAGNAFSGLYVTDGSPINLSVRDGLVIGTVASGQFAGKVAFAIAIDADGQVSVAQYLSIKHDDRGDPNESNDNYTHGNDASPDDTPNPGPQTLDGKIVVTLTVTDSDGDQSTDSVNIGKLINFLDDGPSISIDQAGDSRHPVNLATLALDETHGGSNGGYDDVAASPSFLASPDASKAIGIVHTPTGNQGISVADLFDIDVDGGADGVQSVVTTYTLTLKDNGNTLSNGSSTGVKTNLVVTELDGSLVDNTSDAQRTIYLFKANDGSIIGKIGIGSSLPDYVALHITIDPSTGQITVEHYLPIEHGNTGSYDEAALLKLIDNGDSLGVTATSIVTDGDGDTATATKTITLIDKSNSVISVDDDGPSLVQNARLDVNVYEDGIGNTDDNHPGEVSPSGSAQFTSAAGALNALVNFGTDGPNTDHAFSLKVASATDSGLNSHGGDILIASDGNILRGYVNEVGNSGYQNGDRVVFTLTVNADGSFTFKLLDQIDHASQNGQNGDNTENTISLDLSKYIVATDGDEDPITLGTGNFVVTIQDDVPFVKGDGLSSITVDEDDIQTSSSTGTSPDDGDGIDHSFTGDENVNQGGPANASGTLAGLVSVGADAPLTYGFAANPGLQTYMQAQNLKSYGSALSFEVQGNTLYGFIDNVGSGVHYSSNSADRLVFTLELNPSSGNYKFSLYDQLDHQPGAGQNNLPINFGGALVATDYDGDSVSLTTHVVVNVTDDVPVLKNAPPVSITVDEDDIQTPSSTGTSPDDGDSIDHSFTGSENANAGGPANATGSLAGLVAISGADGPLTYGFDVNAVAFMTAQNIKSQDKALSYQVVDHTLYAFVNNGGAANAYDANDRLVFTLEVNQTSGQFTFSLYDQLDHPLGQGQNNLPIDFGGALVAIDYDQDPVTLTGHVVVNVTDDIPVAASGVRLTAQVDEDDLSAGAGDSSTGVPAEGNGSSDSVTDKHVFTASQLSTLIAGAGADDAATVTLVSSFANGAPVLDTDNHAVKSQGGAVLFGMDGTTVVGYVDVDGAPGYQAGDRIVFKLTQAPNGDITFDLQDQIDHPNASGESAILNLNLSAALQITDYDGDSVPVGSASFIVGVENDIPATTNETVTVGVAEDYLSAPTDSATGVPPGTTYTSDKAQITTAQLLTLVVPGADEGVRFSLNQAVTGEARTIEGWTVKSHGADVLLDYVNGQIVGFVNNGADNETYETGDRIVFTLTPNANGFEFDLQDKLDHNGRGSGGSGDAATLTLDLASTIIATDFDGDAANLGVDSIRVVVENDVPTLVLNSSAAPLTVDETNFAADDSVSAASLFTANYGADGPAASNSLGNFVLHVKSAGVDSGLVTTITNQHVFLFEEGGAIVGRAGDTSALAQNGAIVFKLSLDGSNNLVLDQSVAVRHPDHPSNHDEPTGLSAADLITLTATATDYDLDSVTSTVNIGDKLVFKDDGPAVLISDVTMPTLTTDDTFVTGNPSTTSHDSKSFAALFDVQFGHDGPKDLDHNGVADADAVTYALGLNGGSNVHSGVYDTLTNQEVLLNVDGNGVIVGTVNNGSTTVFTISVDGSGNVTLTQDRAVKHDNPNDPDEALEPTVLNIAGDHQVTLTATVTDGDLDTNHVDLNISGAFQFKDDGPTIAPSDVCIPAPLDYGSIKAGHVEERGLNGPSDHDVLLSGIGTNHNDINTANDIGVGNQWFDATETLRLDFVNDVSFSGAGNNATYDYNGHYSVEAASFTIAQVKGNSSNTVTVFVQTFDANDNHDYDDDGAPLPITLNDVTVSGDATFTKTLVYDNGAVIGVVISGLNKDAVVTVDTAADFDRLVLKNYAGVTFEDTVDGHTTSFAGEAFAVGGISSVICTGATLSVTHDESAGFGAQGPNSQNDVDPDSAPAELTNAITQAGIPLVLGYAESSGTASNLFGAVNYGADGPAASGALTFKFTTSLGTGFAGQNSGLHTTDGNKDIFLFTDSSNPNIVWGVDSSNFQAGQKVFALYLDNAGHIWVAQFGAIAHDIGGTSAADFDDEVSITNGLLFITATAKDGDGDTTHVVSPSGIYVNFQDDGPVVTGVVQDQPAIGGPDDEDTQLAGIGIQGGLGDDGSGVTSTGHITFDAGADGLKQIEITGVTDVVGQNGAVALQAIYVDPVTGKGTPETLTQSAWQPDGNGGGSMTWSSTHIANALILTINADGSYTLRQNAPLNHPAQDDPTTSGITETAYEDNLQITFGFMVVDRDGDSAPGTITVSVDDDMPTAKNDTDTVDAAVAQTLTFDDVILDDGAEHPLVSPYHGLTIVQGGLYNPAGSEPFSTYAPHSGENLLFIGEKDGNEREGYNGVAGSPLTVAHADGSSFTALGAWFSSSGTEPLTITIKGFLNGVEVASFTQDVHQGAAGGPTYVNLSVLGTVDQISFDSPAGQYFGVDDFSYIDNASATGNVITAASTTSSGADELGADGASISGVEKGSHLGAPIADGTGVGTAVAGNFGTLILNSNGSYTYVRADGAPLSEWDVFTYTLKDGDGDTSTATLTIKIDDHGVSTSGIGAQGGDLTVYESNLSDGSNQNAPNLTQVGSFTISADDGLANLSIEGHLIVANGVFTPTTFTTALGNTFAVTGFDGGTTVHYSYTLLDNEQHAAGQGSNTLPETLHVVATDSDGDFATSTITINIVDDVPMAKDDTDTIAAGAYGPETGNVITGADTTSGATGKDIAGADGVTVVGVVAGETNVDANVPATVGFVVSGTYGNLTLNANGSYSYTRNPGSEGGVDDVFTYTLMDGDGDLKHATLTIHIDDSGVTVDVPGAGDSGVLVMEAGLPARSGESPGSNELSNSETTTGSITFTAPDSPAVVTIDGTAVTSVGQQFVHAGVGTLTVTGIDLATGKIDYSYTLVDNTSGDSTTDSFAVVVTDKDGDQAGKTLTIYIVDDVPSAVSDTNSLGTAAVGSHASGNLIDGTITSGSGTGGADKQGADGAHIGGVTNGVSDGNGGFNVTGSYGTLHIDANGDYTYTRISGAGGTDTFHYTLTDGDSDISNTADLTITLAATAQLFVGSNDSDDSPSDPVHYVDTSSNVRGVINGSAGDDTVVGDPGATPTISAGASANIVLVLDTTNSLTAQQMTAMQQAVGALLNSLYNSGAANVRVSMYAFGGGYTQLGTYDIVANSHANAAADAAALVNALDAANADGSIVNSGSRLYIGADPGSNTSYADGLDAVIDYLTPGTSGSSDPVSSVPLTGALVNKVIFISDGEPTTNATQTQINTITGTGAGQYGYTIEAVGLNVAGSPSAVAALNALDSGHSYTNVVNPSDLTGVVGSLAGSGVVQSAAGNDIINGGAGKDIIYGDVMNTDVLRAAAGLSAATYPAGSGWAVFAALEETTTAFTTANDLANDGPKWTRADTLAYIAAHQRELSTESGRTGGDDTITGGTGDDMIFAQEGNDKIYYAQGDGKDTVDGGTGSDTLHITGATGTVTIAAATGGTDIVPATGTNYTDIIVTMSDGGTIRMDSVEDIDITAGPGGVNIQYIGSLANTALDTSTVTVHGGTGDDILDLTARSNSDPHKVIADGGAQATADIVKLDFSVSEITAIEVISGGVKITHAGGSGTITDEFTNFESFQFEGGVTKTLAEVLAIDLTPPALVSIAIDDQSLNIGDTATVTVTFSEAVTGLMVSDFTAANGTLSDLQSSDGKTWTMTLTPTGGNTSSGNHVALTGAYTDLAGNAGTGGTSTDTYAVDTVAPTVTSIVTQTPSSSTTNADSLIFRVTFSEAVSGVDATDFSVSGTTAGISVAAVGGSGGTQYDVTVSGGNLSSLNGAVSLTFAGGQNITDTAGNALINTTPTGTDNHTYTVDNTAPTVSNLVVSDTNIQFDVSEAVTVTGFGTSTVTNVSNHITVTPPAPATGATGASSTVVVTDAAGNAVNAFGLYIGTTQNNGSAGTPISAPLAGGTNVMYGYAGTDFLTGGSGVDYIFGGDGADTIDGNGGADKLSGGAGNDTFQLADGDWAPGELVDGGADTDTITFTNGTTVDFTTGTISNVETLTGTNGANDNVTMSAQQFAGFTNVNLGTSNADTLTVKVDGTVNISGASNTTVTSVETRNVVGGINDDTLTVNANQLAALIGGTTNKIDLGGGDDTLALSNATTANLSGVTISEVEHLLGSTGNDSITLTAAQLAALTSLDLDGGAGDTLTLTTAPTNNLTNVRNVENVVLANLATNVTTVDALVAAGATLTVSGTTSAALIWNGSAEIDGAFNITSGSGSDQITGGAGNDIITSGGGNDTLKGGGGNDTFILGTNLTSADTIDGGADTDTLTFTGSTSNSSALNGVTNVEIITLGNAATTITTVNSLVAAGATLTVDGSALTSGNALTWNGAAETNGSFNITGGAGNDVITGGAQNDIIIGGAGNDTINGGGGADIIKFAATGALNGSDTLTITAGSGGDILNFGAFLGSGSILRNGASGTAINEYTSSSNGNVDITNRVALYSDGTENNVDDPTSIAGIINSNDFSFTANGKMILITGSASGSFETRIWYIDSTLDGNGNTVTANDVVLVGTTSGNFDLDSLTTANFSFAADPIIFDLDHNGFAFTSQADGVQFDINSDGVKDQVAWTNGHDGLLALDVNGNGKIDSGSELFTPTFAGGNFVDALAALASLDSNHDGVIDNRDQAFAQLAVWQDANQNGVTDAGELLSLADLGITGINLDAAAGTGAIDGQSVAAKGTFTYVDGSTGSFVEVDFDASFGDVTDNGGHTLSGENGVADTFVLPAGAMGHVEAILNFNTSEGDKIDLSALLDHVFTPDSDVDKFVHIAQSGDDVTVQVDTTGQGNFAGGSHDVAVLANFAGASHGDIINAAFAGAEHQLHLTAT